MLSYQKLLNIKLTNKSIDNAIISKIIKFGFKYVI